jgi:hypothetical protein
MRHKRGLLGRCAQFKIHDIVAGEIFDHFLGDTPDGFRSNSQLVNQVK